MTDPREALLKRLQATAEVMGAKLSDNALVVMAADLSNHPPAHVAEALTRCRRECSGRLALADIIKRLPGRLSADEAWEKAMAGRVWDEDATIVLPNAIMRAFPYALWDAGDKVAARRSFIDRYEREAVKPDAFEADVSFGYDAEGRAPAIEGAVRAGMLPDETGKRLLPAPAADMSEDERERIADLMRETVKRLHRGESPPPVTDYQEGELLPSGTGL